ncbi:hypothetical protein B0H67DRAFT_318193 [Lasiosphaeris hirsuta]|uniref:Uncharacterized protein n=1 Tax=Lasiosphaeris hirsuta TaxID=260670 RepID=A0AA40A1N5_9PEZI|nr:hypothetical protein B0H67DRAFT_318193 [Lasiosphaeris hirsuta]
MNRFVVLVCIGFKPSLEAGPLSRNLVHLNVALSSFSCHSTTKYPVPATPMSTVSSAMHLKLQQPRPWPPCQAALPMCCLSANSILLLYDIPIFDIVLVAVVDKRL